MISASPREEFFLARADCHSVGSVGKALWRTPTADTPIRGQCSYANNKLPPPSLEHRSKGRVGSGIDRCGVVISTIDSRHSVDQGVPCLVGGQISGETGDGILMSRHRALAQTMFREYRGNIKRGLICGQKVNSTEKRGFSRRGNCH